MPDLSPRAFSGPDRIVAPLLRIRIAATANFRVRNFRLLDGFRQSDIDRLLKYLSISSQLGGMTLRLPQPVLSGPPPRE